MLWNNIYIIIDHEYNSLVKNIISMENGVFVLFFMDMMDSGSFGLWRVDLGAKQGAESNHKQIIRRWWRSIDLLFDLALKKKFKKIRIKYMRRIRKQQGSVHSCQSCQKQPKIGFYLHVCCAMITYYIYLFFYHHILRQTNCHFLDIKKCSFRPKFHLLYLHFHFILIL